jgi:molybdopterin/thiamine biosynthesis adenylyltransferase
LKKEKKGPPLWLIKSEPAGERDLYERIPELALLRTKTIAILGLGCLGAPSALSFARAGIGELRLLDSDYVSPGTMCRWPIGLNAAGGGKVKEISRFIRNNYPFTRISTDHYPEGVGEDLRLMIGRCDSESGYDQMTCLLKLVEGADLIYDATAEAGINQLLSDLAREHKIPYIAVSSRAGGWGGHVLRISPDRSKGCYLCYLHALEDGSIPQPPYDPEGDDLQPVGCGDVTFKAASFDVEEISLAGVRMAVSILCEGKANSYPRISHDIGILSLRRDGETVFPSWETFHLQKHIKCERCQD